MIKRFKQMQNGYFRLLVGGYVFLAIAWSIFIFNYGNIDSAHILPFLIVSGVLTLAYWILVRFYLWIYDGFQKDKAAKPTKSEAKN
jgi:hypothetical protein